MNDLQVECYDAKEVAAKKRSIKKRLAVAGSVIVISAGLFSSCGGNGSWYNSCAVYECGCIVCECINDECAEAEEA